MCGFVAAVGPERLLDRSIVDAMRERVAHRGPDGARTEIRKLPNGNVVAFGHRRLSIIDLTDAASQPMTRAGGTLSMVYNGEIYNYVELRAELEDLGMRFRSHGDTEVLLAAYEAWGYDCLERLNGMFAFAIWDDRRQRLFVARDRFGEKPLFYAGLPDGIAIASEMKALFAHPDIVARANNDVVDAFAAGTWYEDDERTFFADVHRLPPAHAALVDAAGEMTRRWRYWTPDYRSIGPAPTDDEAIEHFGALLGLSIQKRLRSDVPVGTSLSGGLDSSTIVCLLAEMRDKTGVLSQRTFSGRFDDDPTISEGPQIDIVARRAGVISEMVTADPTDLMAESEQLHWHQEEPFLSASIYLQWCVMRLAQRHGTIVLLDGQGADELLAGYQSYFRTRQLDLLDRKHVARLIWETFLFSRRLRIAARAHDFPTRRFDPKIAYSFPRLAALGALRPSVAAGPYIEGVPPVRRGGRLRRQVAEALQYNSLPMLLRYADRNAMAFGRETRFPFLDHDLVDFSIRLPDDLLVRNGWQKYILRRAGEGVVPTSIQWRVDKVGYAAPLDRWLRSTLRSWAEERLFEGPATELESYSRADVEHLWHEHQAERAENSWALWRWISLNEWLTLLNAGGWARPRDVLATAAGLSMTA